VDVDLIILIAALLFAAVAGWITAVQMRRKARKALGRKIKESELTSMNTWMGVEEAEKRKPLG